MRVATEVSGWEETVLNGFLIFIGIGVVILISLIIRDSLKRYARSKALQQAREVSTRRHALYKELVRADYTFEELTEALGRIHERLKVYGGRDVTKLPAAEEEELEDLLWLTEKVAKQHREAEVARYRPRPKLPMTKEPEQ